MRMLFKSVDEKLEKAGFRKTEESEYIVSYVRVVEHGFIHNVDLVHKASGMHIIQSYDKGLMDTKGIGNTCVGLTYRDVRLFLRKMKEKGWDKP